MAESTDLQASVRELDRPPEPLAYPPSFAPSSNEALAEHEAALSAELAIGYLELARYGDFVIVLTTNSPAYGFNEACGFTQDQLERWADLLAAHAERFGLEGRFELAANASRPPQRAQLYAARPGTGMVISIEKQMENGMVTVRGHWWPGLAIPDNVLSAAQLRARADRYRRERVEYQVISPDCDGRSPCHEDVREISVDAGPLSAETLDPVGIHWLGLGNAEILEFHLVTSIATPGRELQVEATTGELDWFAELEPGFSTTVWLPDGGRELLGDQ